MSNSTTAWLFVRCKEDQEQYPCSIQIRDTEERVRQFLSRCLLDKKPGYSIFFHLPDEDCNVRRPLSDLFTKYTPGWLQGKSVPVHCLHGECQPTVVEPNPGFDSFRAGEKTLPAPPPPSCEPDHKITQARPPETKNQSEATNVALHLKFTCDDVDAMPFSHNWEETIIDVSVLSSMDEIEKSIKKEIVGWLKQDHRFLKTLESLDILLTFSIKQLTSIARVPPFTLQGNKLPLETISDFFEDPFALEKAIHVDVGLDLAARRVYPVLLWSGTATDARKKLELAPNLRIHSAQPYRKISDAKIENLETFERVVEPRILSPDYDAWEYVYVRLDNALSDETEENTHQSQGSTSAGGKSTSSKDKSVQTLLGFYFKGIMEDPDKLDLCTVQALDFGDYCIGDPAMYDHDHVFSPDEAYYPRYIGVSSHDELHDRIQQHLRKRKPEPGSGIPFMPSYTFNRYDPKFYGLGVRNKTVHAVVRFVNGLDTIQDPQQELILPWIAQLDFDPGETPDSVIHSIRNDLRNLPVVDDYESESELPNAHSLLFETPLENVWDLELWVLPQPRHLTKLFRFPTGRSGSTNSLGEFLDPRKAETGSNGDCRVYMEAHVVSRRRK